MNKKIAIVLGTRPEAIKLIPIYTELKRRNIPVDLVSTGQHKTMLDQIFSFFEVAPDISLDVMTHNQTLSGLTAVLCTSLQQCFEENNYSMIMAQGDTTTAMVSSLVAYYNRIPVAHIEAGLRTYNKHSPFPEEINRQLIGRIADFHFAPTEVAKEKLMAEMIPNVYVVGNTVIDSLLLCLEKVGKHIAAYELRFPLIDGFEKLVLVTGHRRENFGDGFDQICSAVKQLADKYPGYLFYYPVHLNPNVKEKVYSMLAGLENVVLDNPLPYDELIFLMSRSFIILTDSGGIQEEAPSLNVPVLVMRDTTERPEGITNGCAKLVGANAEQIVSNFSLLAENHVLYNQMSEAVNPYGDGQSAKKIVEILFNKGF